MKIVMHYNPGLAHQVEHAKAFEQAGCIITTDRGGHEYADVHVVSGPHYALAPCSKFERVIWLDRAWWSDPVFVSLGWLRPDGSRVFPKGDTVRPRPWLFPWAEHKREQSCLVVLDYKHQGAEDLVRRARKRFDHVSVRPHPAEKKCSTSLDSMIILRDCVVGNATTALVKSVVMGTPVICTDPTNPVMPVASGFDQELFRGNREQWIHDLSWAQWSIDEIASGLAIEELMKCAI